MTWFRSWLLRVSEVLSINRMQLDDVCAKCAQKHHWSGVYLLHLNHYGGVTCRV